MGTPVHHAQSSANKFGGRFEDYLPLHLWFDETKKIYPDFRHRALRHHIEGIFLAESIFGPVITNSLGKPIPTRLLGEQHVREDLGLIPSAADWLKHLTAQPWMHRCTDRTLPTPIHETQPEPPP